MARFRTERIRVKGTLSANNGDALRAAALAGLGLILQPTFSIGCDIASGALIQVLPTYKPRELTIQALYAPGAAPNAKLRAFIDILAKEWNGTPPWDREMKRARVKK